MELVKFKDGTVKQVTSRAAEIYVKNDIAEIIAKEEVKEEVPEIETKEEKKVIRNKGGRPKAPKKEK